MAGREDAKDNVLRTGKFTIDGDSTTPSVMWQKIDYTVGADIGNDINVEVQLKDGNGNNLTNVAVVDLYFSDASGGVEAGTGPAGAVVIGTDGVLINTITDKKVYRFQSDSTGLFDIDVTDSTTVNFYVNIIHPATGKIYSSDVLAFS